MKTGDAAMSRNPSRTSSCLSPLSSSRTACAAATLSLLAGVASTAAWAADPTILTGTITAPGGEKMGGVTVSAKAAGSTITTTVFTNETGAYYFPALPAG